MPEIVNPKLIGQEARDPGIGADAIGGHKGRAVVQQCVSTGHGRTSDDETHGMFGWIMG
ncbi:hypothetical protein D3OALGA1CA_5036 [Olavius algarvensis associated proteobacterium Delta 3]|nr:hypothetical protein D3OALGA1CA_5036 [Olavius algarvensis associated proteobacterium Delta 3]